MRAARYPLALVRTQREEARRDAEAALRTARQHADDAARSVEVARAACAALLARRHALLTPDPTSGASQSFSSRELALCGAYAGRLAAEQRLLGEQLRAAQATLSERARAVRLAELVWHRAYAEHEALERHHERFRVAARKAAEHAHELEAEELAHAQYALLRS